MELSLAGGRRAVMLAVPRRVRLRRAQRGWGSAERRTVALGVVALAGITAVAGAEVGRVWRRGSAPLPLEADDILAAAEEAARETVEVAVQGYQHVSARENSVFNLLVSFVGAFTTARGVTFLLRGRRRFGPFHNVRLGRRHIHHFVPGILMAFFAGTASIAIRSERLEPLLAIPFGAGMGLTLDESALLLELDDVYWTPEGLLSVQVALATTGLLAAGLLALRFLRRGEEIVLEELAPPGTAGAGVPDG